MGKSWILGAIIVPVGLGIAAWDLALQGSVPPGGECANDGQCAEGNCLAIEGASSVCSPSCDSSRQCPAGLACVDIEVTLQNAGGFHELGAMPQCVPASFASR
jgi:hypothetical protein